MDRGIPPRQKPLEPGVTVPDVSRAGASSDNGYVYTELPELGCLFVVEVYRCVAAGADLIGHSTRTTTGTALGDVGVQVRHGSKARLANPRLGAR